MRYAAAVLTLTCAALVACQPNLTWKDAKEYTPPAPKILVEGLGINDSVAIFAGPVPFSIMDTLMNTSLNAAVPVGYTLRERILRWVFQAVAGAVRWVPGDTLTHTVFADTISGPALPPEGRAAITFDSIPALPCGLYGETLTADLEDDVGESNEADNDGQHFFFVPSAQNFSIVVTPLVNPPELFHNHGTTATHTFTVAPVPAPVAGAPPGTFAHFTFVATEGSTAATVPAAPAPIPPAGLVITMQVTSIEHSLGGGGLGFVPMLTGKVTVISADGCVIRQETARVLIEHQ